MASPQTYDVKSIGVPVLGLNVKDPIENLSFQHCAYMANFIAESQYMRTRNGITIHCTPVPTDSVVLDLFTFRDPSDSASKLFAYVQDNSTGVNINKIFDISTSTPSLAYSLADDTADEAYPFSFKGYVGVNVESDAADCTAKYDGSTWSRLGFTYSAAHIDARVGLYYKGRPYIFSGTNIYYSPTIGAVTGAMNLRSVGDFFPVSNQIYFAAMLSSPGQRASETYMVIGGNAGEILVYGGDNPDSATWGLIGTYKVPPLCGYNSIIEFKNDIWILTKSGIVSMRDLMVNGSRATEEQSVSANINPMWVKLLSLVTNTGKITGCFWPEQNKVFIYVPAAIDVAGDNLAGSSIFVYNSDNQSWSYLHIPVTIVDPQYVETSLVYYRNALYLGCADTIMKMGSGYKDEKYDDAGSFVTISSEIYSGFSDLGKNNKKAVKGWNALFNSDFGDRSFMMRTGIDVGRLTSGATFPAVVSGSNCVDFLSGGHGYLFQYNFNAWSSLSSSTGCKLYSLGVIG